MRQKDLWSLIAFGLFLFSGLGLLIRYELQPQTKVSGQVSRFWREDGSYSEGWYSPRCFIEIDREGQRATYSFDSGYYDQLKVGQTVRLHLKGRHAEYLRVLDSVEYGPQQV